MSSGVTFSHLMGYTVNPEIFGGQIECCKFNGWCVLVCALLMLEFPTTSSSVIF